MQNADYEIKDGVEGQILLVRRERIEPAIDGIPPHFVSCIRMNVEELDTLISKLKDYAEQRRN